MFYFHSLNAYYSEFMEEHALTSFKCWTMVNWVLGSYLWMFFFNVLILITQNSWLLMLWLPLGINSDKSLQILSFWIPWCIITQNSCPHALTPMNFKLLRLSLMCHSFIEVYTSLSFIRRVICYPYLYHWLHSPMVASLHLSTYKHIKSQTIELAIYPYL